MDEDGEKTHKSFCEKFIAVNGLQIISLKIFGLMINRSVIVNIIFYLFWHDTYSCHTTENVNENAQHFSDEMDNLFIIKMMWREKLT